MATSRLACILLFVSCSFQPISGFAQTSDTGMPTFQPQATFGIDSINESNLNLHVSIPFVTKQGQFRYSLDMDTGSGPGYDSVHNRWTGPYSAVYSFFPALPFDVYFGADGSNYTGSTACGGNQVAYYWYDPSNTRHFFGLSCATTGTLTLTAHDNSGYVAIADAASATITKVYDKGGNTYIGSTSITDPNGNSIKGSLSGYVFTFTDELNQNVMAFNMNSAYPGTSPYTYKYTGPNGVTETIKVNWSSHSEVSSFGCSATEYNTTANLINSVVLPDGTSYGFSYLADGRISKITLPTGSYIQYSYPGTNNGVDCTYHVTKTITRTTSDGAVYKFTRTPTAPGNTFKSTYTDPKSNITTFTTYQDTYNGMALVSRVSPLDQTVYCYDGAAEASTGSTACTAYYTPSFSQVNAYHTVGAAHSATVMKFDGYGNTTDVYRYDWNNGTAYPLISHSYTPIGTWNGSGCSSVATYINNRVCYKNVDNGSVLLSSEVFGYDGKGNLTSHTISPVASVGASGNLTNSYQYNSNGTVLYAFDVNNAKTTYGYGNGCNNLLPTSVATPIGTIYYTWDCVGGVMLTKKDLNGDLTTLSYTEANYRNGSTSYTTDPYWQVTQMSDPLGVVTSFYYSPFISGVTYPYNESVLNFNAGGSTNTSITYRDSLGRVFVNQRLQGPSSGTLDTTTYQYDLVGRVTATSIPCATGWDSSCPTNGSGVLSPGTTQTYDAIGRPLVTTDGGGGTVSYSYNNQDVLVTIGPAAPSERTKQKQYEYDGAGRLVSVCEITSASGSAACGQANTTGLNFTTGYVTKYTYDALNRLTQVQQNTQGSPVQTRTFGYDGLGRLTSESSPEAAGNTVYYTYDTLASGDVCGAGTSAGDLRKRVDAAGNTTCYYYDTMHRMTDAGNGTISGATCRRFRYDNSVTPPTGIVTTNSIGQLLEAKTDNCASPYTAITDEWFSYDADGRLGNTWESTPHSGGYYHVAETFWESGGVKTLAMTPLPTITYGTLDGEGRPTTVTASSGQNPVSSVSYDNTGGSGRVLGATYGSGDSDTFNYDLNTGRMLKYTFGMNGQAEVGSLTWNANWSLQNLQITDPFNSADNQTCIYGNSTAAGYDDLGRLISVNCGSQWSQTFSYDAFGNITKTGSISWACPPCYDETTNRYNSVLSGSVKYDANGNLLNDTAHTYTWDANWGRPLTIDSIALTFDAFGRQVEQDESGTFYQFVYEPRGNKLAHMLGQGVQQAFVPLPGGGTAEYLSWGLSHYRHPDWLGSDRLASSYQKSSTPISSNAYAPFGEPYDQTGNGELSFTGQNKDTVWLHYDFLSRQYAPHQGRWISPDPAGSNAADLMSPQTWNRYAYVANNPLGAVDPLGLDPGDRIMAMEARTFGGGCFADPNCSTTYLNGIEVPNFIGAALAGMGAATECGNLCNPVPIANAGWAFASFGADDSISWSFSFSASQNSVPLTNAALAEILQLPTGSATSLTPQQQSALSGALGDLSHRLKSGTCESFYGGHGADSLQSYGANITFGPMTRPTIGGIPLADHTGMILNEDPNGAFLSPPPFFFGAVGAVQVRSFIIAHELAHNLSAYTGFFTNDDPVAFGESGKARQVVNNLRLSHNCY